MNEDLKVFGIIVLTVVIIGAGPYVFTALKMIINGIRGPKEK